MSFTGANVEQSIHKDGIRKSDGLSLAASISRNRQLQTKKWLNGLGSYERALRKQAHQALLERIEIAGGTGTLLLDDHRFDAIAQRAWDTHPKASAEK